MWINKPESTSIECSSPLLYCKENMSPAHTSLHALFRVWKMNLLLWLQHDAWWKGKSRNHSTHWLPASFSLVAGWEPLVVSFVGWRTLSGVRPGCHTQRKPWGHQGHSGCRVPTQAHNTIWVLACSHRSCCALVMVFGSDACSIHYYHRTLSQALRMDEQCILWNLQDLSSHGQRLL